jgi:hypothetical protein
LYRLRRVSLAPSSTSDHLTRLYTRAWCWTIDSMACISPQACVFSLCIHARHTLFLNR